MTKLNWSRTTPHPGDRIPYVSAKWILSRPASSNWYRVPNQRPAPHFHYTSLPSRPGPIFTKCLRKAGPVNEDRRKEQILEQTGRWDAKRIMNAPATSMAIAFATAIARNIDN